VRRRSFGCLCNLSRPISKKSCAPGNHDQGIHKLGDPQSRQKTNSRILSPPSTIVGCIRLQRCDSKRSGLAIPLCSQLTKELVEKGFTTLKRLAVRNNSSHEGFPRLKFFIECGSRLSMGRVAASSHPCWPWPGLSL